MDCYNNYIDYRNGPSPYMHPYHHTSIHPAALRYPPSHQHHFARSGYNAGGYQNYYDSSYRYYHQYSSNSYNGIPPTPPSHYSNYASLREGFSHTNSNDDHYVNNGYYNTPSYPNSMNPYDNYRHTYHHPMAYHRNSNSYYSETFYPDTYDHHHQQIPSVTGTTPTSSDTPKSGYTDELSPVSRSVSERDSESGKNPEKNGSSPNDAVTAIDSIPPPSPRTPNSTDLNHSTSENFCNNSNNSKSNRSSGRRNQREQRALLNRKNSNSLINDPYEFTDEHNSSSPHTESRVPNNECSSQAWMHQGVQNTHKWMRGHHNKKGLPMSDLELLQSSFEHGFYNNNSNSYHPNNGDMYRMSRKMSEKHFITEGPNEIVPAKRTKRRRRDTSEIFNRKVEEKCERKPLEPPLTPLPGFQEAFGSTEIGRFSDAFFNVLNSSPYYEPNNESDIDTLSPQPWEAGDSLEGPHFNLQVGASFTPVYDNYSADGSPLDNYFSELSCNEF